MEEYINNIQIDITYACGRRCDACNRYVNMNSSHDHDMTLDQIKLFIKESEEMNKEWAKIEVMGGEPTKHPEYKAIITLLSEYAKRNNFKTEIKVTSRGRDEDIVECLTWTEENYPDVYIWNTNKRGGNRRKDFFPVGWAPKDCEEYADHTFDDLCPTFYDHYSIGLNYSGFYPVSLCAAVARFFDVEGLKSLKDVNLESLKAFAPLLCDKCGYYEKKKKVKFDHIPVTQTWKDVKQKLKKEGPSKLNWYGN